MKILCSSLALLASSASAFHSIAVVQPRLSRTSLNGFDMSGNSWKPDGDKTNMGSTDTGDFFPDDYDPSEIAFTDGMGGSQAVLNGGDRGFELPGLENLGEDAVVMGGIEQGTEIPAGVDFTPSSVPDGEYRFNVASSAQAAQEIKVSSPCMTFEDFYASFSPDSHPSFSVEPITGRMDRRGGEPTAFIVKCEPAGASGELSGNLVINLPEDNTKMTYKFTVTSM